MGESEPRGALFEACHGKTYAPGTKKPKDRPTPYEQFDAECVVCRQRIALVLGTDRVKLHYAKLSPPKPSVPQPKTWRFWGNSGGDPVEAEMQTKSWLPRRVLFVCVGNACRSPMAEALARHLAADAIAGASAGLTPLGYVCPSASAVLAEIGVSTGGQTSKALLKKDVANADLLINMSGRPIVHGRDTQVEDWQVEDPFGLDLAAYRRARDEIKRRVTELAERLRANAAKARSSGR